MKFSIFVLLSIPLGLAAAEPAADAAMLTPEYRHVVRLDEASLSPFRKPEVRAAQAANLSKNTGPNVPAVIAKFHEMGLSGVIPSVGKVAGLIVLGGQIYREGDDIEIPSPKGRGGSPLVPEHKVVLRSVTAQALALTVTHFGEQSRTLNVPIGLLEFSQR